MNRQLTGLKCLFLDFVNDFVGNGDYHVGVSVSLLPKDSSYNKREYQCRNNLTHYRMSST